MTARLMGVVLLAAVLAGCGACRERPVMCAAAVVVAGAAAAQALDRGGRKPAPEAARTCFNLPADACR